MALQLAHMLGAVALFEALKHLAIARHLAKLGVAVGDLTVVMGQLAGAGEALHLDVLHEGLPGLQLGGADGGAGIGGLTLLGAGMLKVGLDRTQMVKAAAALRDGLRERQSGHVLAALAQGTHALQSETE